MKQLFPLLKGAMVGVQSQSPIISTCGACPALRNAGFGGCAGGKYESGIRLLEPLAAHPIGIPSAIGQELKAFVWDVLGEADDEVAGA